MEKSLLNEDEDPQVKIEKLEKQLAAAEKSRDRWKKRHRLATEKLSVRGYYGVYRLDLRDPNVREGESVGGGVMVVRRTSQANRVAPAYWPFEYGSTEEAMIEVTRLKNKELKEETNYEVWTRVWPE